MKEMDHDKIKQALLNEGADYLIFRWKKEIRQQLAIWEASGKGKYDLYGQFYLLPFVFMEHH